MILGSVSLKNLSEVFQQKKAVSKYEIRSDTRYACTS
jgi:hypothetical protein